MEKLLDSDKHCILDMEWVAFSFKSYPLYHYWCNRGIRDIFTQSSQNNKKRKGVNNVNLHKTDLGVF